jgi:uncharacterized membrane protein YoaK (UPF0700 family)
MSSIDIATGRPLRRDETVQIALLLAFTGGYLDAYTWIVHGVMANTQTANLVLLWVNAMAGKWQEAFHFVPSLFAFMVGVALSSWLRRAVGGRAGQISLLVEISMLILVAVLTCARCCRHAWCLHGPAMQTSIFTKVEGSVYSSVMITGNLRQVIEGAFAVVARDPQVGLFRKSCIFMGLCATFGTGAAAGAFITERVPKVTLALPVAALLLVLFLCRTSRPVDVTEQG